ncbi:MAG: hypothetical protein IPN34_16800 [Planctomycetes bacterium]|nr:hypothetical protein [Planctomycetota bacterium]
MGRRRKWIGIAAFGCAFGAAAVAVLSTSDIVARDVLALSPMTASPSLARVDLPTFIRFEAPRPSLGVEESAAEKPLPARRPPEQPTRVNLRQLLDLARETTGSLYQVADIETERELERIEITLFGADELSAESWPPFLSSVLGSQTVGIVEVGQVDSVRVYRVVALRGESCNSRFGSLPRVMLSELQYWTKRPQSLLMTILPLAYVEPSVMQDAIERLRVDSGDQDALAFGGCSSSSRAMFLFGHAHTLIAIHELAKEVDVPLLEWR